VTRRGDLLVRWPGGAIFWYGDQAGRSFGTVTRRGDLLARWPGSTC